MLRERGLFIANFLIFMVLALLFSALQTSLWFQLFGQIPAPHFWIPILVHLSLYRRSFEGIFSVFILGLILVNLTLVPLGLIWYVLMSLFLTLSSIKQRIYWADAYYFMLATAIVSFLFPIYHIIFSLIFETNPIYLPEILSWLAQTLLTCLFALPFYTFLQFIDRFTHKEQPTDAGTQVL